MSVSADPLRAEVEASLRRILASGLGLPCAIVRTARRGVAEVVAVTRSVLNITADGVLGWDVGPGVPPLDTARDDSDSAKPRTPRARDLDTEVGSPVEGNRDADHLAIPGYEDLAASHIVARLARLDTEELTKIREFEIANRGRRTVVGKIDQLLAAR